MMRTKHTTTDAHGREDATRGHLADVDAATERLARVHELPPLERAAEVAAALAVAEQATRAASRLLGLPTDEIDPS